MKKMKKYNKIIHLKVKNQLIIIREKIIRRIYLKVIFILIELLKIWILLIYKKINGLELIIFMKKMMVFGNHIKI